MREKWTVKDLIEELKNYPQSFEVVLEVGDLEVPLDEVDLDKNGDDKLILRY